MDVVFTGCPAGRATHVPLGPGIPCGIVGFPSWVFAKL